MSSNASTAFAQVAYTNGYEFTQGSGYALPEYPFVRPPELASGTVGRHDIVIVGGGITGLTLACGLAARGVRAVLLDEDNTVGVKGASSRGICYTQKSLEIFQRLGIYERIARKGIQWSVGRTFAGHDEVFSFDLKAQGNFNLSQQPAFINIQQFYIEGYLVERIAELNAQRPSVDMRWQSRVTGFEQRDGHARLQVNTPAGDYEIDATHVIDATGSHTPFHAWCGATMDSKRGDDRWCIADVRFRDTPPTERHTWIEAPFNEDRAVWQHLMGDEVWRIDYQMAPNADPEWVSREDQVRERLRRQFGDQVDCEIVWVGPYAYRSQCLHQLRIGSVFFMGDTAKVVSPFGARGGNTGISDADNLAWKLAAVLHGRAPAQLLDSYEHERLQAAQDNVLVTNRTARFLRPATPQERLFRRAAIGLAKRHAFGRLMINTGRMAVANTYTRSPACAPGAGASVQNVALQWADGSAGCLNDLLTWSREDLLLLVFGPQSASALGRIRQLTAQTPLKAVQVLSPGDQVQCREHVLDPEGGVRRACQAADKAWALVRPDSYLAATGADWESTLVRRLARALALA
jgi:3-(3-hydroxy-phenyl)propionate hydroxylase